MGAIGGLVGAIAGTAVGGTTGGWITLLSGILFAPNAPRPADITLGRINITGFDYGWFFTLPYGGIPTGYEKGGCPCNGWVADVPPNGGITIEKQPVRYHRGLFRRRGTYYVDVAYLTCYIIVADAQVAPFTIDRIELNDKVIFDRFGTPDKTDYVPHPGFWGPMGMPVTTKGTQGFAMGDADATGKEISSDGILTLQSGTWNQEPLDWLEAIHGDGEVPAYRGLAGFGLLHYPLANLDNQAPSKIKIIGHNGVTKSNVIITKHLQVSPIPGMITIPESRIHICATAGELHGAFQNTFEPPRNLCEQVARIFNCDLMCLQDGVYDVSRAAPHTTTLNSSELATHLQGESWPSVLTTQYDPNEEMPSVFLASYIDVDDYQQREGKGIRPTAIHNNPESFTFNVVTNNALMSNVAQIAIDEHYAERRTYKPNLPLARLKRIPGNVLYVPTVEGIVAVRIVTQHLGYLIDCEGRSYDAGVYDLYPTVTPPPRDPGGIPTSSAAVLFVTDTVCIDDGEVEVATILMAGSQPIYVDSDESDGFGTIDIPTISPIGKFVDLLDSIPYDEFTYSPITVSMYSGVLASAPGATRADRELSVRRLGCNRIVTAHGRILHFSEVTDNMDGTFDLSGWVGSRLGSEAVSDDTVAGELFCQLSDENGKDIEAIELVEVEDRLIGSDIDCTYRRHDALAPSSPTFTLTPLANNLKPLSVVRPLVTRPGDGIVLSFNTRTRVSPPTASDPDVFRVALYSDNTLTTLLDTRSFATTDCAYSSAQLSSIFSGSVPATFSGKIWQVSSKGIAGFEREFVDL